jgi:hypothetical protein
MELESGSYEMNIKVIYGKFEIDSSLIRFDLIISYFESSSITLITESVNTSALLGAIIGIGIGIGIFILIIGMMIITIILIRKYNKSKT